MTTFAVEVFQNPYLPPGGTKADAIVTITASGAGNPPVHDDQIVEVIIVDASGSMQVDRRMRSAQLATEGAIDALRDDAWFAVVEGRDHAHQVYPAPGRLVQATGEHREAAKVAVRQIRPFGGTCFGRWLRYASNLVAPWSNARRHVILLTDGRNEEPDRALDEALRGCRGTFECDCRGIGADWQVDQLRTIASELLGSVGIIPEPDQMAAELSTVMRRSMAKHASEVALEVVTPARARVAFVKQVLPFVDDVSGRRVDIGERSGRYPVGSWGDETRSYHVWIDVPPHDVGDEMLAAQVSVVVGGKVVGSGRVLAEWTDEPELSTRLHPVVAHYTGQTMMAEAIDRGIDVLQSGDRPRAEVELGRAARLAAASDHDDTLRLLAGVAEHLDPATGTIRLRARVDALAERTLEAESTKTVAVRRREP